jgi:glucosamine kinase
MILIADSGSTKTDWILISPRTRKEYRTTGINPYFMSKNEISQMLSRTFDSTQRRGIHKIFFYGAGCGSEMRKEAVSKALGDSFPEAEVTIETDLTGTARALFGTEPGIACILGTGSNCGFYDGNEITFKYPSLGYVLGDEGSGTALGKQVIRDFLYEDMPVELRGHFLGFMDNASRDKIMEQIYKNPFPNRFLASVVPFIKKNELNPYIEKLVFEHFDLFFNKHILKYPDIHKKDIGFCGTVAVLFSGILHQVAYSHKLSIADVIPSPMEGLVKFHKAQEK